MALARQQAYQLQLADRQYKRHVEFIAACAQDARIHYVLVGGTALKMLGVISRTTRVSFYAQPSLMRTVTASPC